MNERNLRVLEFSKIRERMSALAITPMGREHALALMPSSDPYTVRMMQAEPAIDGIICAEDPIAAAALRALRDCDRSVPTDVGVIGVNNSSFAKICTPSLTSLDNMLLDLSVTAARNLTEVLRGRHVVKKMMIYSHVVEREST